MEKCPAGLAYYAGEFQGKKIWFRGFIPSIQSDLMFSFRLRKRSDCSRLAIKRCSFFLSQFKVVNKVVTRCKLTTLSLFNIPIHFFICQTDKKTLCLYEPPVRGGMSTLSRGHFFLSPVPSPLTTPPPVPI